MVKKIFAIILLLGAMTTVHADGLISMEKSNYTITIDGQSVEFENDVLTKDDKNYVPLRALCEELLMPITWDEENGTIDIHNESIKLESTAQLNETGLIIPDGETAKAIAKIIFENGMGVIAEGTENGRIYKLRAYYIENSQEWYVERQIVGYDDSVTSVPVDEVHGTYYAPAIWISAKTGEVRKII